MKYNLKYLENVSVKKTILSLCLKTVAEVLK